jgi:hypothetical protein
MTLTHHRVDDNEEGEIKHWAPNSSKTFYWTFSFEGISRKALPMLNWNWIQAANFGHLLVRVSTIINVQLLPCYEYPPDSVCIMYLGLTIYVGCSRTARIAAACE